MKKENFFSVIFRSIGSVFFLPFWYMQKYLHRDEKLWIFGAWIGQSYSDNSKAMFEYVLENKHDVSAIWITHNPKIYSKLKKEGKPVEMYNSRAGKLVCRRAGIIFVSCGLTEANPKYLNGIRQIWLWHGMPMKQIGADLKKIKNPTLFKKFKTIVRRIIVPWEFNDKYEAITSLSDFFTPILTSAFEVPNNKIKILGNPRNDVFFWEKREKLIDQLNSEFNNPMKILYMPTYRDNGHFNPFAEFEFSSTKLLSILDENNMVFLYKGHFYNDNTHKDLQSIGKRFMQISETDFSDLYLLLKDIDVLITDYSSIYFDFLLLKKSIILTPFDFDKYVTKLRPLYFDYFKNIEGLKTKNWTEVFEALISKSYYTPSNETINKFNKFCDGNSAKRIIDYFFGSEKPQKQ